MPGFKPLCAKDPRIMILGSYPSIVSRQKQEYYGHPQNAFWKIMCALFERPYPLPYPEKTKIITENHILLWDVVADHSGLTSADEDLRDPEINDFAALFKTYPGLRAVFFNGKKAAELFARHVDLPDGITQICLMSTSPRNARYSLDQKIENYRQIFTFL